MAKQAWTAGMVSFTIDGKPLLVLELLGSEEWVELGFGFWVLYSYFSSQKGEQEGRRHVSQIYSFL